MQRSLEPTDLRWWPNNDIGYTWEPQCTSPSVLVASNFAAFGSLTLLLLRRLQTRIALPVDAEVVACPPAGRNFSLPSCAEARLLLTPQWKSSLPGGISVAPARFLPALKPPMHRYHRRRRPLQREQGALPRLFKHIPLCSASVARYLARDAFSHELRSHSPHFYHISSLVNRCHPLARYSDCHLHFGYSSNPTVSKLNVFKNCYNAQSNALQRILYPT